MNNLAFFGRSSVAERIIKKYKPKIILDNSLSHNNSYFHNIKVAQPTKKNLQNISSVIICISSINEVKSQIKSLNPKLRIIIPKELKEFNSIYDIKNYKLEGYISSGLPSVKKANIVGGIYYIKEELNSLKIKNLYKGSAHGLITKKNFLYFTCDELGIVKMDKKGKILNTISLPTNSRPHGFAIDHNHFYVAFSNKDEILKIDKNGKIIENYLISNKIKKSLSAQHHVNDLFTDKKNIYVSLFSKTGNWKRGKLDGAVIKISKKNKKKKVVLNSLKFPHNVIKYENSILVLDSMIGFIVIKKKKKIGPFNGFLRGIDFNKKFLFIGESQNRNFHNHKNNSIPKSIDSNIVIYDKQTGAFRSIRLPNYISEIHAIQIY